MAVSDLNTYQIPNSLDKSGGVDDLEAKALQGVVDALQAVRGELQAMLDSADPSERAAIQGAIQEVNGSIASVKSSKTKSSVSVAIGGAANVIASAKERITSEEAQTSLSIASQQIEQQRVFLQNQHDYIDHTLGVSNFSWYNGLDEKSQGFFKEIAAADMSKMAKIDSSHSAAVVTANVIGKDAEFSKDLDQTRQANRAAMKEARAYAEKTGDKELEHSLEELRNVLKKRGKTGEKDNANDYSLKKDWEAFEQVVERGNPAEIKAARDELNEKVKAETQRRSQKFEKINEQTLGLFNAQQQDDLKALVAQQTGIANPSMEDIHKYVITAKVDTKQLNDALWEMNQAKTDQERDAAYAKLNAEQKTALLISRGQTNFQINDAVEDIREFLDKKTPEERQRVTDKLVGMLKEGKKEEALAFMQTMSGGKELSQSTRDQILKSNNPEELRQLINNVVSAGKDDKVDKEVYRDWQQLRFEAATGVELREGLGAALGMGAANSRFDYSNFTGDREQDKRTAESYDWTKTLLYGKEKVTLSTLEPATSAAVMEKLKFNPDTPANDFGKMLAGFRIAPSLAQQPQVDTFAGLPLNNNALAAQQQLTPISSGVEDVNLASLGNISRGTNAIAPSVTAQSQHLARA